MNSSEMRPGKVELLSEIDQTWTKLNDALDRLTPEQMTQIRDPQGWAVKDHLAHLAAWERSVVVFLQGKPRYIGLGIDEQLWGGDEDIENAAIQARHKDMPLAEALADFRNVHSQLMKLIEPMSDSDLHKANSDFQPHISGERDERPVIGMIYGNTADHFREHQEWIESLVSQGHTEGS
jgi:hypothetical protein